MMCEYDSGWEQGHVEGALDERKRLIAKMRQDASEARANGFNSQAMAWNDYANKLEAES